MKFFPFGRLGHTILNLPLDDLWLFVNHSPKDDPWMRGESFDEIIKRIAKLEEVPHEEAKLAVQFARRRKGDSWYPKTMTEAV